LAKELINRGCKDEIILFDVKPNRKIVADIADKVKIVQGDITNWQDLLSVVKEYNVIDIFHLAAILVTESEKYPQRAWEINVGGTLNVLEIAKIFNVKKVVFSSTISTFWLDVDGKIDETKPQKPTGIYGITKLTNELIGLYYYNRYGINFCGVRFPRLFNPGRKGMGTALYPSLLIQKSILGEPYEVEVIEDFRVPLLYIKDAVNALLSVYEAEKTETRIYNLSAISPSAREIVSIIKQKIPDINIKFAPKSLKSEIPRSLELDDTKIQSEIGWKRKYDLEQAIEDFIIEINERKELYV